MFQLTEKEFENSKNQIDTSNQLSQISISNYHGGRRYAPYAFTEQGVVMLAGILRSKTAIIIISIQIIESFIAMRKFLLTNAHIFISKIIKSANKTITIIDNFIDYSTLILFSECEIKANMFTKNISESLQLDLKKYNSQHKPNTIKEFKNSHDRFIIIDNKYTYHIGASLKDLGKKWFAFSKFDKETIILLEQLKNEKNPLKTPQPF